MKSSSLLTGTASYELRSVVRSSSPDIRSEGQEPRPSSRVIETEPETKTLVSARTLSRVDEDLPTTHRRGLRAFRWRAGSNKSEALRKMRGKEIMVPIYLL